jgi:hypothetical protein
MFSTPGGSPAARLDSRRIRLPSESRKLGTFRFFPLTCYIAEIVSCDSVVELEGEN